MARHSARLALTVLVSLALAASLGSCSLIYGIFGYPTTVETPTISPGSGAIQGYTDVTITSGTSGARIFYTLDGSEPSEDNGTLYSGALHLFSGATVKAIAYKTDMNDSGVASAAYTVSVTDATVAAVSGTSVYPVAGHGRVDLSLSGLSSDKVYFVFTNAGESATFSPVLSASEASSRSLSLSGSGARSLADARAGGLSYPVSGVPEVTERNREILEDLRSSGASSRGLSTTVSRQTAGTVGTSTLNFYDYNSPASTVPLTLRYKATDIGVGSDSETRTLQVWVADDCWTAGGTKSLLVTQAMVEAYAGKFLSSTAGTDNDIYDWVTSVLGEEWGTTVGDFTNLIADDGIINIVLMDIDADSETNGGTLGYFYGRDNTTNLAYSNKMICFVIDSVMFANPSASGSGTTGTWSLSGSYWPREMVSTLAHEFQHMISFYQNLDDYTGDTWAEEMMAMCVEDLVADKILADGPRGVTYSDYSAGAAGNTDGRLPLYNYGPDFGLTGWMTSDDYVLYSYSMSYSFGAWLMRQYGGAAILAAIKDQDGLDADYVAAAVTAKTGTSVSFGELLAAWGAAVLLSDDSTQAAPYLTNAGTSGAASFTSTSVSGSVTYNLGAVNFWNYSYVTSNGTLVGPWVNTSSPTYYNGMYAASNSFYRAGTGLSGTQSWSLNLPEDVYLTVVVK